MLLVCYVEVRLMNNHECHVNELTTLSDRGEIIDICLEADNGLLWVYTGNGGNTVNYCPFCGFKAKVQGATVFNKEVF